MQSIDILSLAIVGAAVSALVQFIKTQTFFPARFVVIVLSVFAGTGYYLIRSTSIWQSVLAVLVIANTVYGLVISNFEA